MKAIMVMFDSLNRRMLQPYGCDWVQTPNFQRLAERSVTFRNAYVGSMPCMPARRELHTGRYNFLHRSWGPLEPFDDSTPEILKKNGIYSHLVSDHYHYWEDGGATYHTRYKSWEITRGQEGDPWRANLTDKVPVPKTIETGRRGDWIRQDWVNRFYMQDERDQPQPQTFGKGLEFLETNHAEDDWFLHIETFDPHEPFFSPERFREFYPHDYEGPHFDWPNYGRVRETPEQIQHIRCLNAALVSMCDAYLGKVLDLMDRHGMWEDTMLIVNTDHGFLLGEHDFWAKCVMPFYNEIAHTPLFIWDPRSSVQGEERHSLVQTIDLPATLLEYFDIERPKDMHGVPLRATIEEDAPVREAGLFGLHGAHVNVTDGRYVYMRAPANADNTPLYNYTLMPTHMRGLFRPDELRDAVLASPFSFTKGLPTLRCGGCSGLKDRQAEFKTMLFDLKTDPGQEIPLNDPEAERRMADLLVATMKANDAPPEQFERLGLDG